VPYTLVVHMLNAEPVMGEAEELPTTSDTMIMIKNPRRLDGNNLHYLADNVVTVYWPIDRINFIEIISEEEAETIIGFVRE
jgi:hypothetical protein